MSKEYEGRDPLDIAAQAEQDLNDHSKKFGVQDGTGFGGKTVGGGSTSSEPQISFAPCEPPTKLTTTQPMRAALTRA
jgi:hypothetical protein